jgi:hypothetical protein
MACRTGERSDRRNPCHQHPDAAHRPADLPLYTFGTTRPVKRCRSAIRGTPCDRRGPSSKFKVPALRGLAARYFRRHRRGLSGRRRVLRRALQSGHHGSDRRDLIKASPRCKRAPREPLAPGARWSRPVVTGGSGAPGGTSPVGRATPIRPADRETPPAGRWV